MVFIFFYHMLICACEQKIIIKVKQSWRIKGSDCVCVCVCVCAGIRTSYLPLDHVRALADAERVDNVVNRNRTGTGVVILDGLR